MVGIYKITSPSGRVYIGQSKNIETRKNNYKSISKVKRQPLIERSILKYGWESHVFEVIEECLKEDLNNKERYWQDFYDVLNGGLNCILQGSDEKRTVRYNSIEVYDTFYFETYTSIGEASEKTGICKSTLKSKLSGELLNNTRFVYKKDWDENIFKKLKEYKNERKVFDKVTFQVFPNVSIVSEIYNIPESTLSDYLKGKTKNPTNLEYLEDKATNKISTGKRIIDTDTGISYKSMSEYSRITGINLCTLRYRIKNNLGSIKEL